MSSERSGCVGKRSPDLSAGLVVRDLLARLASRGETVATAESLTGGLVAATIVAVSGASRVFRGGVVAYATDLKSSLAGVDPALLMRHGPVSAQVALALAQGAARVCRADWGLATTGVAGPDAQDGVAPGVVFVAVAGPQSEVIRLSLAGDRQTIRSSTVDAVLALLARLSRSPADGLPSSGPQRHR